MVDRELRMGVAGSSKEDAMDINFLGKSGTMVAGEDEASSINPFC